MSASANDDSENASENELEDTRLRRTTADDADVEDNVYPLPPIRLVKMLRTKPPVFSPVTPCRLVSEREEFMKYREVPTTADRLNSRPKSALETITDTIEKPEGTVPPLSLPHWYSLPLHQKIPLVHAPRHLFYYSPGKLSIKLQRKPKEYSVLDPYNMERVVQTPYSALNDPHTEEFIKRPETRRLLYSQGLINENDEVMYTLGEFNKYRSYLRTLYSDDVHKCLHVADTLEKNEREQLKSIHQFLSGLEGKSAEHRNRLTNLKRAYEKGRSYLASRFMQHQKLKEMKLMQWTKAKEQIQAERIVRNIEKQRLSQQRIQKLHRARESEAAHAYYQSVLRNLQCYEKKRLDTEVTRIAHENALYEWVDAKINESKARVERDIRMDIARRQDLKDRAAERQKRMEASRRNIPNMIARRKQEEKHRWELARKYFYIWLNKVRERRDYAGSDSTHESVWVTKAKGTLEATVAYIRLESGAPEKLDDFILNIIKLKAEIAKQLALEEAEEMEEEAKSEESETPEEEQAELPNERRSSAAVSTNSGFM